jgi:hypothetical protein
VGSAPVPPFAGDSSTGEPDAGNPHVRFGGRGGANPPSLPLSIGWGCPPNPCAWVGARSTRAPIWIRCAGGGTAGIAGSSWPWSHPGSAPLVHARGGSEVGPGWNRTLPIGWGKSQRLTANLGMFRAQPEGDCNRGRSDPILLCGCLLSSPKRGSAGGWSEFHAEHGPGWAGIG